MNSAQPIARTALTQNRRASPRGRRIFVILAASLFGIPAVALAQASISGALNPQPRITPRVDPVKQRAEGQSLFLRDWLKEGKLNETGDGLGPMSNDVSCVACHQKGGVGGSAPNQNNVDILSLWRPRMTSTRPFRFPQKIADRAAKTIHPGFEERTSFTLHRTGGTNLAQREKYKLFRYNLTKYPDNVRYAVGWRLIKRVQGIKIEFTQRNTPALFGAGFIDRVPDSVILETARRQAKRHRGITGRVAQTPSGAIGRFGWRGQTATLHDFVLGACANELGLSVPTVRQPPFLKFVRRSARLKDNEQNQFTDSCQLVNADRFMSLDQVPERDRDLTEAQCQSLTAFVVGLPAPRRARKLSLTIAKDVHQGEKLFHAVGCAACHVPDMKPAIGLYSDLLLHDMGPKLSDPLPAVPEISDRSIFGTSGLVGYSGIESFPAIAKITTNIQQEWRTPPLWGVGDSAPYLHDGRAATLNEAILWHGGEARGSARKYKRLSRKDRRRIVMFLSSLVAPDSATRTGIPPGGNPLGGFSNSGVGAGFFSVN